MRNSKRNTMSPDIKTLRGMNLNSIEVMTMALQRLRELLPATAANPMLEDFVNAEISTVELELRIGTIVQTRLQASKITVKPLNEAEAAKLNALAEVIDKTIQRDAVVNAALSEVIDLIKTAADLRDLVKSSTTVPV